MSADMSAGAVACVNCVFDSLPFPLDTADVFWRFLDTIEPMIYGDSMLIFGAAYSGDFGIGVFIIRLTLWNTSGNSLTTLWPFIISEAAIDDEILAKNVEKATFLQEPFTGKCPINPPARSSIEIFDLNGRLVYSHGNKSNSKARVIFRPENSWLFFWQGFVSRVK